MQRWWKANRPKAPKLFAMELADARRQIAERPDIGHEVAMILALWGAPKEHGPDIDPQDG